MLKKIINYDINSVSKHKALIMECLKDYDNSIKLSALNLTYIITNPNNVKDIVKELLNSI